MTEKNEFKNRHKSKTSAFTRERKLPFSMLLSLLLQKSVKSLQLLLNEMVLKLDMNYTVTNSAYTQARANLNYTAFIELNEKAVVEVAYEDMSKVKLYKDMRVLGIDGSKVMLPNTKDIVDEFGQISYKNNKHEIKGKHAYGVASVMYDVLNHIVIDSTLSNAKAYEVDLAIKHLSHSNKNDLIVCDRNYPSYYFLSSLIHNKQKFVIRTSASSFAQARELSGGTGVKSQTVLLKAPPSAFKDKNKSDLPHQIKVRFVRVVLPTGENEILITNLLDEKEFPTKEFLHIYNLRWGVESFYDILKNRLGLENFTGKTALSVYQDFYAMIYLSGIETIVTYDTNKELQKKQTKNPQKVNHAVSFNAIKNQALDIIFSKEDPDIILEKLERLFSTNTTQVRKNRKVPRLTKSDRHRLNWHKRDKKICY